MPSNRHSGRKLLFSVNDLSHFEQVKGFSPVWVLSCIFNGLLPANDLSHFEQVKDLSPEWVLSCFFNGGKFSDFLSGTVPDGVDILRLCLEKVIFFLHQVDECQNSSK